jgi:hypothetical protein
MDVNLREVAGVLLLLGSAVFFLIGFGIAAARPRMAGSGGGRSDEGLRMLGVHRSAWSLLMGVFSTAVILTLLGFGFLTLYLLEAGVSAALGALLLYGVGAALMLTSTMFGLAVTGGVGEAAAKGESIPDWFRPLWKWSETLYSAYMALAYSSVAVYSALFLMHSTVPPWLGWTSLAFGAFGLFAIVARRPRIGGEVAADFPLLIHLVAIPIGIALLLG